MASQVPAGAEGTVAGVMIYCSICLIASMMMIWLTWTHQERTSCRLSDYNAPVATKTNNHHGNEL